jgi:transcriptional regulator with XRE-family HTH domain
MKNEPKNEPAQTRETAEPGRGASEPAKSSENFRVNLRAEIDRREVSQVSVAESAGISTVYLSMILHGKATPSLGTCDRLAEAVGVAVEKLFKAPKKVPELS